MSDSGPRTTLDEPREPHAGVERRYQMTRVRAGDYLLPSNDGGALWRVSRYREDGSLERHDGTKVVGDFWRAARFRGSLEDAERLLRRDVEEFLSLDSDRWVETDCLLPTRAAAVAAALDPERTSP